MIRKSFNIGLYLFIALHLLLLTVYVLPHRPASNAITGMADLYMSHLFHQEWDLFAPAPPVESLKLMYQGFNENGYESKSVYPAEEALEAHLSGTSVTATKEVYLNRRYAQYLIEDIVEKESAGADPYSLLVAQYYCSAHAQAFELMPTTRLELIVKRNGEEVYRSEPFLITSDQPE